jgi:biotin synthase
LMQVEAVVEKAKIAKASGATRFCMGAAWRSPRDKDLREVESMVREVKALGMETCCTLGMLTRQQAQSLQAAGLDYYNHNLDSSPEYYEKIISTRTYQDRLDTLEHVRNVGMKTCCGGIVGMGEAQSDRVGMFLALANLPAHPDSVPINNLVQVQGTPLTDAAMQDTANVFDAFEFIRTIAIARIMMPRSMVRLSAGREQMNEQMQAQCFFAGANSIFYGEKLLTTGNPDCEADQNLFRKLGIKPMNLVQEQKTVHAQIVERALA